MARSAQVALVEPGGMDASSPFFQNAFMWSALPLLGSVGHSQEKREHQASSKWQ